MFRRILSSLLIGAMLTGAAVPAMGESGITAGEALFGTGSSVAAQTPAATEIPAATEAPAATGAPQETAAPEEEMYGAEDAESITDYPVLQLGDKDAADGAAYIVMLQNKLIELGFLYDVADGAYGENTAAAVKKFQELNGMEGNGIADEQMQMLLFSGSTTLATPAPEKVLSSSELVQVQNKLIEWGFLVGSADGKMGRKTTAAIKELQNYLNTYCEPLPTPTPEPTPEPTPTPDPNAMPMVNDVPLVVVTPAPTPYVATGEVDALAMAYISGEQEFEIYRDTVEIGEVSDEAKRVQARLKQLKYLYPEPDGEYGMNSARALMYFQYKHGLEETGVADEETQRMLFSPTAQKAEEYVYPYKIYVDISDQKVYVFKWDGRTYSIPERMMICSTGKDDTPTPTGTYQAYGRLSGEWYYFEEYECYAKWAYGIVGGIFFHSVTFRDADDSKMNRTALNNLGKKASHGCIRLTVEDVKWIYDNCPYGTTVVIQE